MNSLVLGFILVLFGAPPIALDWKGEGHQEFQFTFDTNSEPCRKQEIDDGFKVKYKFRVQGCRPTIGWSSECGDPITEIHDIRFDPVTESFKVTTDRLGDELEPRSSTFSTAEEAFAFAARVESFTYEALRARSSGIKLSQEDGAFVRARVFTECKDGFEEAVSWLPYVLTFGLVDRVDFDSGWYNFYLK